MRVGSLFWITSVGSVHHCHGIDLDETTRIGGKPHHLDRCCRWFGVAEIFRPNTIERVLLGKVGHETIGGNDVRERRSHRGETALEVLQGRTCLTFHGLGH